MPNGTGVTADATNPVVSRTLNVANLTPQQRSGLACVLCGSSDQPMTAIAILDGVQIFTCTTHPANRPAWLTQPCPAWCVEKHHDSDDPEDRNHRSDTLITPLLTMDFINYGSPTEPQFGPLELMCDLVRHHLEAEPRINIGDTNDAFSSFLSLGEAEQFAWRLLALVHAARTSTIPTDPAPADQGHELA
ncbi:DUF6907 domain-containing protein [Microbispora rosea]|uniref:DUF6907 domain-containing protein n=1 Tax=Microbispora rosea TaxID=58117 RepID=UPI0037B8D264